MSKTNNEDVEMLPCPFCGCTDIEYETFNFENDIYQDKSEGACSCQNCGAKGGVVDIAHRYKYGRDITPSSKDEAVVLWNTRKNDENK